MQSKKNSLNCLNTGLLIDRWLRDNIVIHPTNHLERLKLKEKHEQTNAPSKKERGTSKVRRRRKEELKKEEFDHELDAARYLTD